MKFDREALAAAAADAYLRQLKAMVHVKPLLTEQVRRHRRKTVIVETVRKCLSHGQRDPK